MAEGISATHPGAGVPAPSNAGPGAAAPPQPAVEPPDAEEEPTLSLLESDDELEADRLEALQRPALERAVSRLPVPYWIASLVLAIVASPIGGLAVFMVEDGQWDLAVYKSMGGYVPETPVQIAAALMGWTLVSFVMLMGLRNITRRVDLAQADLGPLLPGGNAEYRAILAKLTNPVAPVVIGAMFVAAAWPYYSVALRGPTTALGWVANALHLGLDMLIIGTSVWSTAVVWRALHEIGQRDLKLRPFEVSSSLGLRPIGELDLAAAAIYFLPIGILGLIATLTPSIPSMGAILLVLVVIGAVLFVLPLRGAHDHMQAEKGRRMKELRRVTLDTALSIAGLTQGVTSPSPASDDANAGPNAGPSAAASSRFDFGVELAAAMTTANRLRALEIAEQKLGAMHTWPVDTKIVARLMALAIPLTMAILTDAAKRLVFRQ